MKTMTLTEFNQNSSRAIAYVAQGETVQVTRRGLPVAEVTPPRSMPTDPVEAIFASGIAQRPTGRTNFALFDHPPFPLPAEYRNIDELLEDINGDRDG